MFKICDSDQFHAFCHLKEQLRNMQVFYSQPWF